MTMSKKHFIMLADYIKEAASQGEPFTDKQLICLAQFCRAQNSQFKRERWIRYIKGECGPNGGEVKR